MLHRVGILLTATAASLALALSLPAAGLASPSHPATVHAAAAVRRSHRGPASHVPAGCRASSARSRPASSRGRRTTGHGCPAGARRTGRVKPRHAAPSRPAGPSPGQRNASASAPSPGAGGPAALAAALATPCQNTELMPEAGNLDLVRAAILCLVNRERAQNGVSPLRLSDALDQAAEGHSHELIEDDYFAHVSPDGETPVDRIRATGYIPGPSVGYVIGENLAWGTYGLATPQAIASAWIASPEHLANILEGQYSETGIGVVPDVPASVARGAPGATYAQEFGVIIR